MSAPNAAPPVPKTFIADADLVRFRFVKLGVVANSMAPVSGITDRAVGVAQEDVTVAQVDAASIWLLNEGGIVPVEAAAAISLGAAIAPSANGRAQTAVSTQFVRGLALQAATGAGHVIPMLVEVRETVVP